MLLILKRVYLYATAASIVDMAARRSTALPAAFGARLQALNEEVIGGLLPEKQVPKPCSYPLKQNLNPNLNWSKTAPRDRRARQTDRPARTPCGLVSSRPRLPPRLTSFSAARRPARRTRASTGPAPLSKRVVLPPFSARESCYGPS